MNFSKNIDLVTVLPWLSAVMMLSVKIACDRDDSSFMTVDSVDLELRFKRKMNNV